MCRYLQPALLGWNACLHLRRILHPASLQSFAIVRDYEAGHVLDTAAVRRAAAAPSRADAVQAARHLAFEMQPSSIEQLWHSGVCLLPWPWWWRRVDPAFSWRRVELGFVLLPNVDHAHEFASALLITNPLPPTFRVYVQPSFCWTGAQPPATRPACLC